MIKMNKKRLYALLLIFAAFVIFLAFGRSDENEGFPDFSGNPVVLETSEGNIEILMNSEAAPHTVDNFVSYVKDGFYEGTVFHRVIKGFMIQGGGFLPDGTKKATKAPVRLESNNGLQNIEGMVAMARTNDPNSATSQFFINTVENPFLDYSANNPGYAVFGEVVSGMDVVKSIEAVSTSAKGMHQNWPIKNVIIEKAYVKQ